MNRRDFLKSTGAAGLGMFASSLFAASTESIAAPAAETDKSIFATQPFVQLTGTNELTVCWSTPWASAGCVYWRQGTGTWQRAVQIEDGMVRANEQHYHVPVRGIDPRLPLEFYVEVRKIDRFLPYEIRTLKAMTTAVTTLRPQSKSGAVSMVFFNDLHNNPKLFAALNQKAQTLDCSVAVFNGDCIDGCMDENAVRNANLVNMATLTQAGQPSLFIRGNHETRGAMARRLKKFLATQADRYYGALTIGPMRVIYLDTGEDKDDTNPVYGGFLDFEAYIREQATWFKEEIAKPEWTKARWRVVLMHIPPECDGTKKDSDWRAPARIRENFDELFARAKITAMLCGHIHHCSLIGGKKNPSKRPYPILIGGGPWMDRATCFHLTADAKRFSVVAYGTNGQALDVAWSTK